MLVVVGETQEKVLLIQSRLLGLVCSLSSSTAGGRKRDRNRQTPPSGSCRGCNAASQRRRLSPGQSESSFRLWEQGLRDLLLSNAAAPHACFCSHEAETEEAAAVRGTGYSRPSFPPQCRAVVFISGPSVRQLARHSGRSGRAPTPPGKDSARQSWEFFSLLWWRNLHRMWAWNAAAAAAAEIA